MRRRGEERCCRSQWRLIFCVNTLRTAVTRVIPLCGAAGWWVVLLCLLPSLGLYALGRWGLKRRGSTCLHGKAAVCGVAFACLAVDGVSSMTTLGALFTEGAGTPGTQFTLALVAAGMMLFALDREGLARGIYMVRRLMLGALALVLVSYGTRARVDHLFPVLGGGWADVRSGLMAGAGMGWPLLLALMEPPVSRRGAGDVLPPALVCVVAALCLCLCIPHEVLVTRQSLGDTLVQTVAHLSPFVRLVAICLWMSGLFLSMTSVCSLGGELLLAPWGLRLPWIAGAVALLLAGTQLLPLQGLRKGLQWAEPVLLLGLCLCSLLCWRKK